MADAFQIVPYKVRSAGTDVPPEEIQTGINSLASQTQTALNTLAVGTPPSGAAGGDLGGAYPNPTVTGSHIASGTINGASVGATTPSTGAFTTLTATTPVAITSGGTGSGTAAGARTNLGLGTIATQNANNVAITGGTIDGTPIGGVTPANGTFNALNSTSGALNGTVGATTPNTGVFTTLSASSGINSTAIGQTTPAAGAFTTLTATTPVGVASGGTGRSTLTIHGVLIGETTGAINQTAAGTTGQMLLGVTGADPAFGNNPTITGGTIDNAVIGGTTKAAGSFTTVVATGTITPSSTNGIIGTTTNDNANAGSVGEYQTSTGALTGLTTGTYVDLATLSLTAGDWDVTGVVQIVPAGTTNVLAIVSGLNTVANTNPAGVSAIGYQLPFSTGAAQTLPIMTIRFSLSSTTTVRLGGQANFNTSTCQAQALIRARRVR